MGDGVVAIEYGAIPNQGPAGGWLPAIWENGRQLGDTWANKGFDREHAEAQAKSWAHYHACRHVGDWAITIKARP